MSKLVNALLYGLLFAVVLAGMKRITHFIVREKIRVELETEKQLAAEQAEMDQQLSDGIGSQPENVRMVLVKELPVYKEQKIVKIKAGSDTQMLSYGSMVTVMEEDGLYARIQTENGTDGYVWGDCIGIPPEEEFQTDVQPRVVVIDAGSLKQEQQEQNMQESVLWSLKTAAKLEKKLEARGYAAVLAARQGEDAVSIAKSTELANQIQADAVIHLYIDSSADPAASGAAACCVTADSPYPAAESYADSKKLAKSVLKYYTKATGVTNAGILEDGDYPGIQQSERPVILLRMGSQADEQESRWMGRPKFRARMAGGIADGVDAYFSKKSGG